MSYETISDNPQVQAEYEAMREAGESHNMAEMLALQAFPFGRDENRILMQGKESGKFYSSGLARFQGDPRAIVSSAADIRRIAQEDGLIVKGTVNVSQPEKPPTPSVPIAKDIVERAVKVEIAKDPGKAKKVRQVREAVTDRLTPYYKKH